MDSELANKISDRIVDMLNEELAAARRTSKEPEPTAMLAGQLMALLAFIESAPDKRPVDLDVLALAAKAVLRNVSGVPSMAELSAQVPS